MEEKKLSEELYKFNAWLSTKTYIKKEQMELKDQEYLNKIIAKTIEALRIYEDIIN